MQPTENANPKVTLCHVRVTLVTAVTFAALGALIGIWACRRHCDR
jgi:hypothetical protein